MSSLQLEAFSEVARSRSFSKAAKNLHVTQSALSQRINNLETELGTGLLIRDPSGLRLTAAGEELLRFCQVKESLEAEVLGKISSAQATLGGVIRIAGFSSVTRSVIMPALNDLIVDSPQLNVEILIRELRDLPRMLANNEVDLIVTTDEAWRQEVMSHDLGFEENVLVDGLKANRRKEVYLDHDTEDTTTATFFKKNGERTKNLQRNYLDEVYTIIDGVKQGWGRAVLPKHIVKGDRDLQIIKGYKPLMIPVRLQYFRQPYYSQLHTKIVEEICARAPRILKS